MGINLATNNWYYNQYAFASFHYNEEGIPKELTAHKWPTWIRMLIERCSRDRYRCPKEVEALIERWCKKKNLEVCFIKQNGFRGIYERYLKFGIILEKSEHGTWWMGRDEWADPFEIRGCKVCSITPMENAKIEFLNNQGECSICERMFYSDNLKGSFAVCKRTYSIGVEIKETHQKCWDIVSFFMHGITNRRISKIWQRAQSLYKHKFYTEAATLLTNEFYQHLIKVKQEKNTWKQKPQNKKKPNQSPVPLPD